PDDRISNDQVINNKSTGTILKLISQFKILLKKSSKLNGFLSGLPNTETTLH
ncbi:9101_t:CDS:1, partial [Diversispora eburnea]